MLLDAPSAKLPFVHFHVVRPLQPNQLSVGVPVVLEYDTKRTPLYPPEGMLLPATAIYTRVMDKPHLSLVTERSTVTLNGAEYPLATNYTAPGLMLGHRARRLARSGFSSMIRPEHMQRKPQIYLLDPYDPTKIPVLMVHGLQSTPVAFLSLVNALHSDSEIRKHFQIWQFHYATGTPLLANALTLREQLARAIREVDPRDQDFATKHIVVLGHSMGGLIAHTLASSSGNALWSSLFTVPPEKLRGHIDMIDELRRVMFFRRNPRVVRLIFMATPHRGSILSDSLIGGIGKSLTQLPPVFQTELSELAESNPSAMTPAGAAFARKSVSGVSTLSPRNPSLLALSQLAPGVPFHSIIGQHRPGPRESGTDGVVAYTSSHLDGAESELVVRSGHGVLDNPDAEREVIRILRLEVQPASR
jgi:pimeloyl-ACP methyl ester carboxylesterase